MNIKMSLNVFAISPFGIHLSCHEQNLMSRFSSVPEIIFVQRRVHDGTNLLAFEKRPKKREESSVCYSFYFVETKYGLISESSICIYIYFFHNVNL